MSLQEKIPDRLIDIYLEILNTQGYDNFLSYIIAHGILNPPLYSPAHIYYMNKSEAFLNLYRETKIENYLLISKALRRAAHKFYRQYLSINTGYHIDRQFLNVVK